MLLVKMKSSFNIPTMPTPLCGLS